MRFFRTTRNSTFYGIGLAALIAGTAVAQETPPPVEATNAAIAPEAEANGETVGEIVVTARREAELAQRVPLVISAFNGEALRAANVTIVSDLKYITPGISTQGSGSDLNPYYAIRGITRQITGNGQPGVISYFAEVPLPPAASNVPFFDMSNVQVLKGPQGTLFGRNTVGGALLFYPATPTYEFEGYVNAKVQNYDGRAVEAAVNIAIVPDKVAIRIAGLYDEQDGYTRNTGVAGPAFLGGHKNRAIRASLLLEPLNGLKNITIFDYDKQNATTPAMLVIAGPAAPPPLRAEVVGFSGPRVTSTGGLRPDERIERWGVTNRTELMLSDNFTLINIFGYRSVKYKAVVNLDGSGLPLVEGIGRMFNFEQWSDELQLHANFMDEKVKLIAGGFYLKGDPLNGNLNYTQVFGGGIPNYAWDSGSSKSLFANVSVKLDEVVEGLRFTAGYRHTWDTQTVCSAAAVTGAGAVVGVGLPPFNGLGANDCRAGTPGLVNVGSATGSFNAPGWTIGLDWQASRSLFLYAVSRRGYRSGGVNNPTFGPGLSQYQTYRPETNTDIEIGFKSDWRIGGLVGRLNVAAFYSWQKNVQIAFTGINQSATAFCGPGQPVWIDGDCDPSNNPASGALMINAGDTSVKGIEAELVLKPAPWLTLSATGTLLDPSITRAAIPGGVLAPFAAGAGAPTQFLNQNIANKTIALAGRVDLPIPESAGKLTLGANFYATSEIPVNALIIPCYTETSARLDWKGVFGSTFDIGAFAQNIFDQTHTVAASFSPVALSSVLVSGLYNRPRMYGLEARFRW